MEFYWKNKTINLKFFTFKSDEYLSNRFLCIIIILNNQNNNINDEKKNNKFLLGTLLLFMVFLYYFIFIEKLKSD